MRSYKSLWFLSFTIDPIAATFVAESIGAEAEAVTILSPPRKKQAVIEAIYASPPARSEMTAKLAVLCGVFGLDAPAYTLEPAPNLDWLKKVSEDFPPLHIGRWTIHGALHRPQVPNRLFALQIDATNAFGTGEHPTTRGCLHVLDDLLKTGFRPRRMADIGCGSGILAMACLQVSRGLGCAVDLDPDSVQIASHNARINGLSSHLRINRGHGYQPSLMRRHAPYDLIMANIFARPLSQMAHDLTHHLQRGGWAILSGLLTSQANRVINAHRMQGLSLIKHVTRGEWSVLALRRPARA